MHPLQRTLNTVTNKLSIVTATYKLWNTRSVDIQNVKICVLSKHYTETKYDTDVLKHVSVNKTYYNLLVIIYYKSIHLAYKKMSV